MDVIVPVERTLAYQNIIRKREHGLVGLELCVMGNQQGDEAFAEGLDVAVEIVKAYHTAAGGRDCHAGNPRSDESWN